MVQKCVDEVSRHSNSSPVPLPGTDATCQQHFDACKQAEQRAHMCHDMTGPASMAGRLGAMTFCLPLAGIACHGLIAYGHVF